MEFDFGLSRKAYKGVVKHMHNSIVKIFKYSCKNAVNEEKIQNEENNKPFCFRRWELEKARDEGNCTVSHRVSSGKMEVYTIKEMFLRSEEFYRVRYGTNVGDDNTRTFKALLDVELYGEKFKIQKSECIGHVEKCMGTRLRTVKKTAKIGGKG
ncbi:hypothetical protein J437_LFUL005161 [Ladona fulva]|uniref:Mutator-like transposase domain-containing protein n=1 Tax=Ladona fulva TaxID=123851 RepID=A0A8K0NYN0_LADFU|nr:hypothetical protein J437_LFUL005161 [Ladona fulva]